MKKEAREYCVYNQTRETFLALRLRPADTLFARLKGLLGAGKLRSDEGIWITPSRGIHTIGLRFSIDVLYLDAQHRVIETIESFGTFRIAPLRMSCASVLELPTQTIYWSGTQVGDQLIIGLPEEMEQHFKATEQNRNGTTGKVAFG